MTRTLDEAAARLGALIPQVIYVLADPSIADADAEQVLTEFAHYPENSIEAVAAWAAAFRYVVMLIAAEDGREPMQGVALDFRRVDGTGEIHKASCPDLPAWATATGQFVAAAAAQDGATAHAIWTAVDNDNAERFVHGLAQGLGSLAEQWWALRSEQATR